MGKIYTALGLMSGTSMDGVDASIISSIDGIQYDEKFNEYYEYDKRKIYENKSDADAQAATTETRTLGDKTYTYQPSWWKNSTVVEE